MIQRYGDTLRQRIHSSHVWETPESSWVNQQFPRKSQLIVSVRWVSIWDITENFDSLCQGHLCRSKEWPSRKPVGPEVQLNRLPELSEPYDANYRSFDPVRKIRYGKKEVSLRWCTWVLQIWGYALIRIVLIQTYPNVTALRQISYTVSSLTEHSPSLKKINIGALCIWSVTVSSELAMSQTVQNWRKTASSVAPPSMRHQSLSLQPLLV